jgi:hypothetical protein
LLRLRAQPGVDGIRSFRALLKVALRRFGLRAVDVREVYQPPTQRRFPMSAYSEKIARAKQQGLYKLSDFANGEEKTHTISCLLEDVVKFEREMDVLCFTDTGKQLQLNITNGSWLIDNFGDDPNDWGGHRVTLYVGEYEFKGREKQRGIKLKQPYGPANNIDDEIPY